MKRISSMLALSLSLLMLSLPVCAYAPAEMSEFNQEKVDIYIAETAPKLDGVVDVGEYGDPIRTIEQGDAAVYFNGEGFTDKEQAEFLPSLVDLYAAYDDKNLYIACEATDPSHCTPLSGTGVWDGDYLEFDVGVLSDSFDCFSDKLRLAIGLCSEDNTICAYSALNPAAAKDPFAVNGHIDGVAEVKRDEATGITTYEAIIPWSAITADGKAPAQAFFYYQLGIGDENYIDRSDYSAYLGVYRYSGRILDEKVKNEVGIGTVPNLFNFAGEAPEIIEIEDTAASDAAAPTTSASTADMASLAVLALALSAGAAVVFSKKK